ncbi:MAG: DUF4139 domain-containing protein [Planctomycetota bacterium]|nr:DUF4139 domain-containing protein [Planctomycetota bacterium]
MNTSALSAASVLVALAGMSFGVHAQPARTPSTSVTIYSAAEPGAVPPSTYRPTPNNPYAYHQQQAVPGFAIVRQDRPINLGAQVSEVRFTDVAALIDPTTVSFTCLTDPGTRVLEQNYQFDLVSPDKLLENFIDREITVTVPRGDHTETITGTLLSSSPGQFVLAANGGLEVINGYQGITFPSLPEGFQTRPTLVWKIGTAKPGAHTARVSYETEGVTWWADYNLIYHEGTNENAGFLDVGAWVSILNRSGGTYDNAQLKLVAGSVNRAPRQDQRWNSRRELGMVVDEAVGGVGGFAEKSFFEYHLYTLGRSTTIPNNSTKQIELFPAAQKVPCDKVVVYDGLGQDVWFGGGPYTDANLGSQTRKDVDVYVRFRNTPQAGLGMPFPAGRIRISKVDEADGGVEFIGEDVIRHTPRNEEILVKVGKAFDVVGERIATDFKVDHSKEMMEETIEITVRNRKQQPVDVIVQERLVRWLQWEIVKSTHEFTKIDARRMHHTLRLAPDEEKVIRYTVRYTW